METVLEKRSFTPRPAEEELLLVERAREGDRRAFDALVHTHFPRVYSLLFRLVGNHEDAEDLAQECFVKAYRSLRWFRGDSRFGTWTYRIAVHLARDHRRAQGRRPAVDELRAGLGDGLGDKARAPVDEMAGRELVALVERAVQRLPERLQVALVLRVLEGLDYDEVARVTGVTSSTARTHVMKARRELSRLLGPLLERRSP